MDLPAEKLNLVRLLLDTNDKKILDQVKALLESVSSQETAYLLSNPVNADHLREGIKQVKEGKTTSVNVEDYQR